MQTIKPSELVELGKIISAIRAIEPETTVKEAYQKVQRLFELLDLAGLKGTISEITNPAAALRNELDQIESIEYAISMELAIQFERFAEQVQNELERECRKSRIFVPTIEASELEKLIDSEKFVNEFDLGALGWIPRVAKEDFQDAARCLAFDMYTGAASLMLRATEACLGKFYRLYCQEEPFDKDYHIRKKKGEKGKKDCKETVEVDSAFEPQKRSQLIPKSYMWADMLSRLQGRSLDQIDPDLYVELEILGKYFRNPIQHAARRYNLYIVEKLLPDMLLPLVKSYLGDQNPADKATLGDFIHKLDLPQQD